MPDREGQSLDPDEILRRLQQAMSSFRREDATEDQGEDAEQEDEIDPEVLAGLQALEAEAQQLLAAIEEEGLADEDLEDDELDLEDLEVEGEDDEDVSRALSGLLGMADGLSGLMERLGFQMPDVEAMLQAEAEDPYGDPDWGMVAHITLERGMEIQVMAEFDLLRAINDGRIREAEADEETREDMQAIASDVIGGALGKMLNEMRPGEDAARILDVQVGRHVGDKQRPMVVPPETRIPLDVRGDMLHVDLRPLIRAAAPSAQVVELAPVLVPLVAFEDGSAFTYEAPERPGGEPRRIVLGFDLLD